MTELNSKDIERIVVWEYGVVGTRSDFVWDAEGWIAVSPARRGSAGR